MKQKKRTLITGVSGLLGNNLAFYFREKHDVMGLYHSHSVEIEGIQTKSVDILDLNAVQNVIRGFKPDIIVHCASITNIDFCEENKKLAEEVNVQGTRTIVQSLEKLHTQLVYISSDAVYGSNLDGPHIESEICHPDNFYSSTKLEGEKEVLTRTNSLVLRTNFFGWNIQNKHSLAEWVLSKLSFEISINGFNDVHFSSIYTFLLAKLIEESIGVGLEGIFNCASHGSMTKYEFACRIADQFGLNRDLIAPISVDNSQLTGKRTKNLVLNVHKIEKALNKRMPDMMTSIAAFHRDHKNRLPQKIQGIKYPARSKPQDFLYYGKHYVDDEDIQSVTKVLLSDNLTQGNTIATFEEALCQKVNAKYAVVFNSGTSALHAACLATGLAQGHEVITSPITFVASANCAVYCNAIPVFADIESKTYNISPDEIEKKITSKTHILIPVHFAGQSCCMEDIVRIKEKAESKFGHRLFIIEDGCHALGSIYKDTKVGSCAFSDMTVMSFHPVKHITTGEGGVVFTNDEFLAKQLKRFRSHGITGDPNDFVNLDLAFQPSEGDAPRAANPWYHEQMCLGYNYRITDIQCALGLSQLKKLDSFIPRRREIVNLYNIAFGDTPYLTVPFEDKNCLSNFHLYVLLFDFQSMGIHRARFMLDLKERGIQTQVHYLPVHLQPFYQKNYYTKRGDCPRAEAYYDKCLSIPLYPAMTNEDVERVIYEIKEMVLR
ncbi:UDP-4-amino-4,6-dideoxy-N-acetyl-beta-L-altrosamine transaminase [candidate division WS5 bacterium]|uniref:UDP-4-amino-4, 6-dideoxy-N-acetyl-beta-L-altrosamine transaminase n=1 Tax=candidate division WS5 bacterium TaxID=2093353 RepID=A0A419DFB7_9BACT|nr:MAG: UDP-4-amino-4,6-dideoxy-N-acetyl-beta-L-altrosamine transaminase [candidate division WS5 bacterium]